MPDSRVAHGTSRRSRRRGRRRLVWAVVILMALPLIGGVYQSLSVRRGLARFPPPGQLVDIGGRRLHLLCLGTGTPTVIFESSTLGTSLGSGRVREAIARETRVCSYDRVGMGWSDAGADEISSGDLADDLARLLERAAIPPTYVLVPASVGGLTAEMFARRHPDAVAGMVFVDAGDSVILERAAAELRSTVVSLETPTCLAKVGARFGVLRVWDPLGLGDAQGEDGDRTVALTYRVEPMATLCALVRGLPRSVQEFAATPALRTDVPLTVLTADSLRGMVPPAFESRIQGLGPSWRAQQERLSKRSTRGVWRVVPDSDHLIAARQPEAVTEAILDLLRQLRAK